MPASGPWLLDPHPACFLCFCVPTIRVKRGLLFLMLSTGAGVSGHGLAGSSAQGPGGCSQNVVGLGSHPETQRGKRLPPFACGTGAGAYGCLWLELTGRPGQDRVWGWVWGRR